MEHFFLSSATKESCFPVPRVRQPPVGHAPTDNVLHLGILHGHTGIAHCLTLGTNGIASLIGFLIFLKLHLERGAFVFLHTDTYTTAIVSTDSEAAVEQALRQRKLHATLAEAVGNGLLFAYHLIVGVAQFKPDLTVGNRLIVKFRHLLPHNGRHEYGLSRTIDAAVGKQVGMYLVILMFIIGITSVTVRFRTVAVCLGKGKHAGRILVVLHTVDDFTLTVGGKILEGLRLAPSVAEA